MSHRSAGSGSRRTLLFGAALVASLLPQLARGGIIFGQLDDFLSGTAGWTEGASSPNPPTVVSGGGPGGAVDPYLVNVSSGGFGSGSKQIMFNQAQWTGDFNAAGVTRIEMQLANFGATPLSIRLALSGGPGQFASTSAVELPAGSGWSLHTFNLTTAAMTSLSGSGVVSDALMSVSELRILAAAGGPAYNGDAIASSLGVDSIRALRQPGDATFDGLVNFADLVVLAQNYNHVGKASWGTGDFNFDNAVGFADLVILAQNYNSNSVTGTSAEDVGGASFGSDWARAQSLIPEPCSTLLSAGGLYSAVRRRRHSAAGS